MNNAKFFARVRPSSSVASALEASKARKEEAPAPKHADMEAAKKSSKPPRPQSEGGKKSVASRKTPSPKTSLPSPRGEKEKKKKKKSSKSPQVDDAAPTSSKKRKVEQIGRGEFIFQTSDVDECIVRCATDLFKENTNEALEGAVSQVAPLATNLRTLMELSTQLLATSCHVTSQIYWELDTRSHKFEEKKAEANEAKQSYIDLSAELQKIAKENVEMKDLLKQSQGKFEKAQADLDKAIKRMEGYKTLQLEHEKTEAKLEASKAENEALKEDNSSLQKRVDELDKSFKDWKILEPKIAELPEYGKWAKSLSDAGFKFALSMFESQPQPSMANIKKAYVEEWTTAPDGTRAPDEEIEETLKALDNITVTRELDVDEVKACWTSAPKRIK